MSTSAESFDVMNGMRNPRKPSEIGWMLTESFEDRPSAMRLAKKMASEGFDLVRVVRVQTRLEFTHDATEQATA